MFNDSQPLGYKVVQDGTLMNLLTANNNIYYSIRLIAIDKIDWDKYPTFTSKIGFTQYSNQSDISTDTKYQWSSDS